MPRKVKEMEFTQKRNDILDSVSRFVYSIGFEQMSIQNILDDLKISKGAFYHYFDSKADLLIGIIDQMGENIYRQINPIIDDPSLNAIEKLHKYFGQATMIKMEQAEYLIPLVGVWYKDENLQVREKLVKKSSQIISPILGKIIQQGKKEGLFICERPEIVGQIIYQMIVDMGNSTVIMFCSDPGKDGNVEKIIQIYDAYEEAIEKILGTGKGTIHLISDEVVREWAAIFYKHIQNGTVSIVGNGTK